jgi:hypothetical protein
MTRTRSSAICRGAVFGATFLLIGLIPAARADLPPVGVNPGAPIWGGSILFTDALAADIAGSGCRAVRINFRIDGNSTWTAAHLAKYDQIIQSARNQNLEILGIIAYEAVAGTQAQWNENYNTTGMNPYIATFADKAWLLINRYKDDVKQFELWNEPDCWSVPPASNPLNPGCFYIWPKNYANVLAETYKKCIQNGGADFFANNGISLVTAGLFGHDIGGSFSTSRDYMTQVYQQSAIWNAFQTSPYNPDGRQYPWDFFGYHFYLNQDDPVSLGELSSYFNDIRAMKQIFNDPTDIIVTEFGWRTISVSEQLQADNLKNTYNWLRSQSDVHSSMWYQWNNGDGGWGLVYSIGNPKPAYYEFAAQCGVQPIDADFFANPTSGPFPLNVQFTDSSIGVIDSHLWDFGDGHTSPQANPVHQYTGPGTYTVSLTITGPGGQDTETKTDYITVGEPVTPSDLDGDGDTDLADYAALVPCVTGSGVTTVPAGCPCAALQPASIAWETASSMVGLSAAIAFGDVLHGVVGTVEVGGFFPGLSPAADPFDLTDGTPGSGTEAVLLDYSRPALQIRMPLSAPTCIRIIRVFASNGDGRSFQNYDVYYSVAGNSAFELLASSVTSGPFGQVNTGNLNATMTEVYADGGALAYDVDALRFVFYDVSSVDPASVFWDPWDADEPEDADGNPRAYVAPVIKEIDVFEAGSQADLDGDGDVDVGDLDTFLPYLGGPE